MQLIKDAADLLRGLGCVIVEANPPVIETPEESRAGHLGLLRLTIITPPRP